MFANVREIKGNERYNPNTGLEKPLKIYFFKLVIMGDSGVGKSTLLRMFNNGQFHYYPTTIGIDFHIKTYKKDQLNTNFNQDIKSKNNSDFFCKMQLWDTAGQERFRVFTRAYYRGAAGLSFCFDITRRETFENLERWIKDAEDTLINLNNIIIVGCKCDLKNQRQVSIEEATLFAEKYNTRYIETSSKDSINVDEPFLYLAKKASYEYIKNKPNFVKKTNPVIPPKTKEERFFWKYCSIL